MIQIIDVSNIIAKSKFSMFNYDKGVVLTEKGYKRLSYELGGVFKILSLIDKTTPQYLCFDNKDTPYLKQIKYPAYKKSENTSANILKFKESLKFQLRVLYKILEECNCNVYSIPGYEADDIVYSLVKKMLDKSPGEAIEILSSDSDLSYLVKDNVYLNRDPGIVYSADKTIPLNNKKYDVPLRGVPIFKAISGDYSDNISKIADSKTAFNVTLDILNLLRSDDFLVYEEVAALAGCTALPYDLMEEFSSNLELALPQEVDVSSVRKYIDFEKVRHFADAIRGNKQSPKYKRLGEIIQEIVGDKDEL